MKCRLILILASTAVLASCGGTVPCAEPGFYMTAQQADPLLVPDDLDNLQAHKELTIPEPSPRLPRSDDAGCLESPPAFQ